MFFQQPTRKFIFSCRLRKNSQGKPNTQGNTHILVGSRETLREIYVHSGKFITFSLSAVDPRENLCTHREIRIFFDGFEKNHGEIYIHTGKFNFSCRLWKKNSQGNSWNHSNLYIVRVSSFNLGLKLVCGISPSYELQIRWFFFPIFSKITFFHLMLFIFMIIAVILDFYIWLIFFHSSRE